MHPSIHPLIHPSVHLSIDPSIHLLVDQETTLKFVEWLPNNLKQEIHSEWNLRFRIGLNTVLKAGPQKSLKISPKILETCRKCSLSPWIWSGPCSIFPVTELCYLLYQTLSNSGIDSTSDWEAIHHKLQLQQFVILATLLWHWRSFSWKFLIFI